MHFGHKPESAIPELKNQIISMDQHSSSEEYYSGAQGSSETSQTRSSSDAHKSSETNKTGSSSITWRESSSLSGSSPSFRGVSSDEYPSSLQKGSSTSGDNTSRRKSSSTSGEDSARARGSDSSRSSLRRFKEGSKIFVGFIEDADDLKPSDDMLPPMTWEEKCEIIEELCLALEKRLERLKNEKEAILDGLRIRHDVANHNIGMARKDRVELQRNVLQFAELLSPSKKPYTDDMLRFLNGRLLDKRLLKEKLQQRNRRLQKMVTTASEQLTSKVDIKDVLHESDIMELENFNKDVSRQLAGRSHMLDRSRFSRRNMAKVLENMRHCLQEENEKSASVKRDLADRSPLVGKYGDLILKEVKEKEKLQSEFLGFVKGESLVPTAMGYMKIKQQAKDLRKELNKWLTKVEIAELSYHELGKLLQKQHQKELKEEHGSSLK